MPDLNGERKKLNLKNSRRKDGNTSSQSTRHVDDEGSSYHSRQPLLEEDDSDVDEIINSSVKEKGKPQTALVLALGIGIVVLVVLLFLLFRLGSKNKEVITDKPGSDNTIIVSTESNPPVESEEPLGVGVQDFTQDTNMTTSDTLTDPEEFVQDIYGLTTRVDYTVDEIIEAADFVSYTKHRGTFGHGLEIYWLEATYKESEYVIQVPFKYYKELDDVGIVPVKMEVLRVKSNADGSMLTIISYMSLDEKTLETILKSQKG